MPHIYSIFGHLFEQNPELEYVAGALLVTILLMVFAWTARRALQRSQDAVRPDARLSVRTLSELVVGSLRDFVINTMGEHARPFVPFFGAIFIYILVNNLLGLVPGFNPPTSHTSTNFAVAFVVFMLTHVVGVREHGVVNYLKHFWGPVVWLGPLIFVIEAISHVVRPVSLSLRLYGNMTGDHAVLSIFTDLTAVGVPVIFLGLGVFISLVQALVFTILSMIYIQLAMEHEEGEHEGEHTEQVPQHA